MKAKWKEMNAQEPLWDVIMGFVSAVNWQVCCLCVCVCVNVLQLSCSHISMRSLIWCGCLSTLTLKLHASHLPLSLLTRLQEPWIMGILLSHLVLIGTALLTRKRGGIQACIFALACE